MSVKENLIAARALIDTPEKWLPGWLNGLELRGFDVGQALSAAAPKTSSGVYEMCDALERGLPEDFRLNEMSGLRGYVQYIDMADITHADIMAMFDRAIEAQP